ncbi:MAG: MlaD family protein [Phycisphaerales bacterium]
MTGLTAIVGIAGLFLMLFLFKEFTLPGEQFTRFSVVISDAGGVDSPAPVLLNGVRIGQVDTALVVPSGAELSVRIRASVKLPKKATVVVDKGLVGDSSLQFIIPPTLTREELADVVPDAATDPDFRFVGGVGAQSLTQRLESMVNGPLAKLESTAAKIEDLASTYKNLGERLTDMVEPRTLAEVEAGKQPNLRSAVERADLALAAAERWLSDEALLAKVRSSVDRADKVLTDAQSLVETWKAAGKTIGDEVAGARADVKSFLAKTDESLNAAKAAADSVSGILERVAKGEGTAGQLVVNPDLYNSIKAAADRLDLTLTEIQLLAERYRKEGLPIKLGG